MLVSASVAFLAVPGIDDKTRILGIVSTLFSIASIIVGLLNVWQHQHKSRASLEITVIVRHFVHHERKYAEVESLSVSSTSSQRQRSLSRPISS